MIITLEETWVSRFFKALVKYNWSKQTLVYSIYFIIEYNAPLCDKVLSIHVYKAYNVMALATQSCSCPDQVF